jgi:hypothetical protein
MQITVTVETAGQEVAVIVIVIVFTKTYVFKKNTNHVLVTVTR